MRSIRLWNRLHAAEQDDVSENTQEQYHGGCYKGRRKRVRTLNNKAGDDGSADASNLTAEIGDAGDAAHAFARRDQRRHSPRDWSGGSETSQRHAYPE